MGFHAHLFDDFRIDYDAGTKPVREIAVTLLPKWDTVRGTLNVSVIICRCLYDV